MKPENFPKSPHANDCPKLMRKTLQKYPSCVQGNGSPANNYLFKVRIETLGKSAKYV